MDIKREIVWFPKSKRKLKKIIRKICNENKKLEDNGRSFENINDVISIMQFALKSIHYVKYENKKIEEIFNYLNKKAYKASFSMDNGEDFYFYRICFI